MQHLQHLNFTKAIKPLLLMLLVALLGGCVNSGQADYENLEQQLKQADSLYFINKGPQSLNLLHRLRPKLNGNLQLLSAYYNYIQRYYVYKPDTLSLYADSAMAIFKNKENINRYPGDFLKAAIAKGNACLRTGKYVMALDYYERAKKVLLQSGICDDGNLASKMGSIYYDQKNFKMAARYWLNSYNKLGQCPEKINIRELFFKQQGALDNVALSYERAGMLDSARYYYDKDLQLIKNAVKEKVVGQYAINWALEVLYDNLGGLNLKLGNLAAARNYLDKCLAIPDAETDGTRIPPLIKLAELNIKTGNLKAAYQCFSHSKKLLDKYLEANTYSDILWKRLYAAYLVKVGKVDSSYYYLDKYIATKELLDQKATDLYRLNVAREVDALQQQRSIAELSQKDKVKKLYLAGVGVFAALSLIIVYLVYRNLKKERKSHMAATLQNQQLQQTLSELERVNQNYMRIMRIMAHDLRNPISGMIGLATVLLASEDNLNDESRHMLGLIESTGMHSIDMISELLKTGLADEHEKIIKKETDLRLLLYDSVELLQFKANEKRQQIIFEAPDTPVTALVNHEKIWRVFNNLIVNAIKFSHEGANIRVGLKPDKDKVTVLVADTGIGIPPENKDKVFEMFTSAKKVGTGGEQPFGLGLSISKRIIDMHNGKIWFESTVSKGTTFFVEIPVF